MKHSLFSRKTAIFAFLIQLAILLPALQAATIPVAAVDLEEHGLLAQINLQSTQGKGQLFLNISSSLVDADTQASIKTAIAQSAIAAGKNPSNYDFTASILSDAQTVNGPSAGAAFAVLAYSEFTGKQIRNDFSVTGTIEENGRIGRVGGVPEKVGAMGNYSGIILVAVPIGQGQEVEIGVLDEENLVQQARETWGIQVYEVANLSELLQAAFSQTGTYLSAPSRSSLDALLPPYAYSQNSIGVKQLAEKVTSGLEDYYNLQKETQNYSKAIRSSVQRSILAAKLLVSKGYFYTSANAAFLVKSQLENLELKKLSKQELSQKAENLLSQAENLKIEKATNSNWEWVAGAQLRRAWALDKLSRGIETLNNSNFTLNISIFNKKITGNATNPLIESVAYDVASSRNWIEASVEMNRQATQAQTSSETGFEQEKFREYAEKLLNAAFANYNSSKIADEEIAWHLKVARSSLQRGEVFASIFDSIFAQSYLQAQADVLLLEKANETQLELLSLELDKNAPFAWNSFWAETYYAHAKYSEVEASRTANPYYFANALKLKHLAILLEQNHAIISGKKPIPENLFETIEGNASTRFPIEIPIQDACGSQNPLTNAGETDGTENASSDSTKQIPQASSPSVEQLESQTFQALAGITVVLVILSLLGLYFIWNQSKKDSQDDEHENMQAPQENISTIKGKPAMPQPQATGISLPSSENNHENNFKAVILPKRTIILTAKKPVSSSSPATPAKAKNAGKENKLKRKSAQEKKTTQQPIKRKTLK